MLERNEIAFDGEDLERLIELLAKYGKVVSEANDDYTMVIGFLISVISDSADPDTDKDKIMATLRTMTALAGVIDASHHAHLMNLDNSIDELLNDD